MYITVSVVYCQITFGPVFPLTRRIRKRLGMNRCLRLVLLECVIPIQNDVKKIKLMSWAGHTLRFEDVSRSNPSYTEYGTRAHPVTFCDWGRECKTEFKNTKSSILWNKLTSLRDDSCANRLSRSFCSLTWKKVEKSAKVKRCVKNLRALRGDLISSPHWF